MLGYVAALSVLPRQPLFRSRPAGNRMIRLFSSATNADPYTLVIVESPAKAKTIAKYLNSGSKSGGENKRYVVEASMGHVRDLPQNAKQTNLLPPHYRDHKWSTLGIDIDHGFDPMYVIVPDRTSVVNNLKEMSAGASEVVLATDEDREGEVRKQRWRLIVLVFIILAVTLILYL